MTPLPQRQFYFVRHGQTDWNLAGRMQGRTDIPLNAHGLAQAEATAALLPARSISHIITSPLLRALRTAAALAQGNTLPLYVENDLLERSFGRHEGELIADIRQQHNLPPAVSTTTVLPPDAEPADAVLTRATTALAHWLAAFPSGTPLFVGHKAFFRLLCQHLTGMQIEALNAGLYHFTPTPAGWQLNEM